MHVCWGAVQKIQELFWVWPWLKPNKKNCLDYTAEESLFWPLLFHGLQPCCSCSCLIQGMREISRASHSMWAGVAPLTAGSRGQKLGVLHLKHHSPLGVQSPPLPPCRIYRRHCGAQDRAQLCNRSSACAAKVLWRGDRKNRCKRALQKVFTYARRLCEHGLLRN